MHRTNLVCLLFVLLTHIPPHPVLLVLLGRSRTVVYVWFSRSTKQAHSLFQEEQHLPYVSKLLRIIVGENVHVPDDFLVAANDV